MRYLSRVTGAFVEAVQLSNDTFTTPTLGADRFFGVLYDRLQRRVFVKNDIATVGDWIVKDQHGRLTICNPASFEREYKPAETNVIPFRR